MLEFGLLEGLALTDTSFAGLDVQTMLLKHILRRFYRSGAFGHHRQQNSQNFNMWVGALLDLVDAVLAAEHPGQQGSGGHRTQTARM